MAAIAPEAAHLDDAVKAITKSTEKLLRLADKAKVDVIKAAKKNKTEAPESYGLLRDSVRDLSFMICDAGGLALTLEHQLEDAHVRLQLIARDARSQISRASRPVEDINNRRDPPPVDDFLDVIKATRAASLLIRTTLKPLLKPA